MELKRAIPYDINISPSANNGFIVRIGCGEFVADSIESLIGQLHEFLNNPKRFEKEYSEKVLSEVREDQNITERQAPRQTSGGANLVE